MFDKTTSKTRPQKTLPAPHTAAKLALFHTLSRRTREARLETISRARSRARCATNASRRLQTWHGTPAEPVLRSWRRLAGTLRPVLSGAGLSRRELAEISQAIDLREESRDRVMLAGFQLVEAGSPSPVQSKSRLCITCTPAAEEAAGERRSGPAPFTATAQSIHYSLIWRQHEDLTWSAHTGITSQKG